MRTSVKIAFGLAVALALGACGKSSTSGGLYSSPAASTAASAAATASPAAMGTTVHTSTNAKFGKILVDASGRTLYTFDQDTGTTSACTGSCATTWPPLTISSGTPTGASGLGTVKRADGSTQVTYKGKPLYTFASDASAGDATGDGVGGFHVAKASA